MGKPSSTSLPKNSECSIHHNQNKQKSKVTMSAHKMEQNRKKNHHHVRKNIRKLFNRLKQDTTGSTDSSPDYSRIPHDSTPRNMTIVVPNDSFTPQRKRKSLADTSEIPKKCRKSSDSLIILSDNELTTNNESCILISPPRTNSHINCSTPIAQRDSQTLQNLIINNFTNDYKKESCANDNSKKVVNKTKEINRDSYLTIDLTADSENRTDTNVTVIDVEKSVDITNDTQDCTLVSVSNADLSVSGESDVTVVRNIRNSKNKQIKKFANGIAQLNSTEKGKLLEYIAQKIFSGCDLKNNVQSSIANFRANCATDTDEDTYIKEVILGEHKSKEAEISHSRNSIGSNIYHPSRDAKNTTGLRMVVIDGSNVAMEHTKGRSFSVQGLKICIDYFLKRGHIVKAFVPRFRCKFGKSSNPGLLDNLERQGLVVYTPSREIKGKACVPYDDRYIIQCAAEFDGVVVSGDNYRDLINENERWRYIIENRILPFTWVNDMIMFPKDPFGRGGPTLETLLRHPTPSNIRNETKGILC